MQKQESVEEYLRNKELNGFTIISLIETPRLKSLALLYLNWFRYLLVSNNPFVIRKSQPVPWRCH